MSYTGHSDLLDVTVPIDTKPLGDFTMKPLNRMPANKGKSASHFRSNVAKTKVINLVAAPMRGGIRL